MSNPKEIAREMKRIGVQGDDTINLIVAFHDDIMAMAQDIKERADHRDLSNEELAAVVKGLYYYFEGETIVARFKE